MIAVASGCGAPVPTQPNPAAAGSPAPTNAASTAPTSVASTTPTSASSPEALPLLVALARAGAAGPVITPVRDMGGTVADEVAIPGDALTSVLGMAWSDDGRLAVAVESAATGTSIYALDEGSDQLRLISGLTDPGCESAEVNGLAWAGHSIVVELSQGPPDVCQDRQLVRVDPAKGTRSPIEGTLDVVRWAVSPDGRSIAHDASGTFAITDVATGVSRGVDSIQNKVTPAWSPDGGRVIYVSSSSGTGRLAVAPRDASGPPVDLTDIAVGVEGFTHVGWGADSGTVFFRSWARECTTGCDGFYRLDIAARKLTRVVALPDIHQEAWNNNFGYDFGWSISPDGSAIAYDLTPGPGQPLQVFVVDARGASAPRAISGPLLDASLVGWISPTIVVCVTRADQLVFATADGDDRVVVASGVAPATVVLASGSGVTRGF